MPQSLPTALKEWHLLKRITWLMVWICLDNDNMKENILINILSLVRQNESHKAAKSLILNFERVAGNVHTLDINAHLFKQETVEKIISVCQKFPQYLEHEFVYSTTLRLHFNIIE